ncbi:hypothetical protein TVAG_560770 [Trichomonas vaginalis G3]|uniref:RTR1-type domain-containing protein n=1 Tax=Trichomonas vaginalis (strain ATCC PRA-98 / G3) TaxID=412133 RepID=A2GEJ4_TRIV3|nr:Rtr1/RPAP2 family [Trichomonas vaginalis G3]XP_051102126.1 Rtr1/RPAP2 family [Trichomonas vaginalis G3]EAX84424.1 hypothetical protein TVAG_560770 [Trichomonas vaginalis G3]KAI5528020.1 Rtr1/RPAP2 family [Trichomonas vaginalis G3]KAI5534082.1 Rtr1/RPAP2 family [Trichomonas vaginalis G3]|eukprot:XP_001297354.1 hypothetical protein [Trichomonas vaginalis G3]
MDNLQFAVDFCEPIVRDEIFNDPRLQDQQIFKELMIERNCSDLCGWPKCDHHIKLTEAVPKDPVFCSTACRNKFFKHFATEEEEDGDPVPAPIPLGPIVEKFTDMRPPKKLTKFSSDEIEGKYVRVGPYRDLLNEIETWVGGLPVTPDRGMNDKQERLFELVNSTLQSIDTGLKKTNAVIYFFVNLRVNDLAMLLDADQNFKDAFSFAMFETMTGQDMSHNIEKIDFSYNTYKDILTILDVIPPQPEKY